MNEPFPSKETFSDQIDSNTLLFSRSSVNDLFFNTLKPDLSLIKEDDYDDSKYSSPYRQGRKSHSPLESQISPKINKSQKKTLISTGLDYEDINKEHIKKTNENNINIDNPVSNINLSKEIKDEEDEESSGIDLEDEIYAEKLRQEPLYKENQCLIFPDDVFKEIWEIILALMILYSCLWVPYYMAFDIPTSNGTTTVDVLCDIIFIIDILINFNSAFYDCQDVLVINRGEIAKEYIKFWFWLDFISALPFSFIIEYSYADKSFRFQRLTKLTRFIRFFKMIKERNKILKYVNKVLKISSGGAENLLGPVVFMTLFCHITSCFYYMMCVYEEGPDTWINYYIDKEDNEKYLTTFYWVTQTVVTTGYGDIPCKTAYEKMFAIGVMLIGVLVYSFCVGSITNFLINLDEEHEIFNEKIITLYSMKHYYDLDFFLCKRIERFLRFGKKTQIQEQQKNLLMELPKNLKIELSAIMYKNLIVGIEFFKNKPKRFLAFICPYLKLIKINQEDYICDEGDRANEIYFIKSGTVAIVLKNFDNYIVYSFQQGDYFGEIDLLFTETRTYTFMARTNCELLCMSKNDFLNIFFIEFKTIGPEIEKNAKVKRAKIKEEYEKAIKICRYQKKQTSLFKKLNTIDENSLIEKALYRRTTLFSQNEDPENGAKSSYSSDDDEFFDEESPNQNVSPLLKMHKVQMDSPKISEVHKKTLLFGKQLELEERMSKFDEKLENLENTLAEFFKSYEENNKLNSSLDWKQEVDQTNLEKNLGYAKKKNENEEIIDCYSEGEELENGKKKKNYYRRESNFSN